MGQTWTWAVRIDAARAAAAAALRLRPGIEVLERGGDVWLRGGDGGEELDLELRRLPGADRFEVAGEVLRLQGHRVPAGRLPEGTWQPVAAWASAALQDGSLPAELTQRVKPALLRSAGERPPNLLRLPLRDFAGWAARASAARLRPLAFAANGDEALVRGEPLPPLDGTAFAESGGVAVPCGWEISPAAGPAAWRERLKLEEGDLAVFHEDGTFERVAAASFVRASRSAVRATVGHA